jgi:TP901 family phage tail tape measure protein
MNERLKIDVTSNVGKEAKRIQSKMAGAVSGISKTWSKATGRISSGLMTMTKALALAAPLGLAVREFAQFEKGMAEVSTLTDQSVKQIIHSFGTIVEGTQVAFGKNQQDVIKTLYDGISAGVPVTQKAVSGFLKATGTLSIAGVADMKVAGDAVSSLRNAFKEDFNDIADSLMSAVKIGKTTLPELASVIGQVAPIAQTAGLSMDRLLANVAVLTKTGDSTAGAVTKIKAAISNFVKPAAGAAKVMEKMGIKIDAVLLKEKGLRGAFELITKQLKARTKNQTEFNKKLAEIFPNIRAFAGAAALAGASADDLGKAILIMKNNTGLANTGFLKMDGILAQKLAKTTQKLRITTKKIGEALKPMVTAFDKIASEKLDKFNKWLDASPENAKNLAKISAGIIGVVGALGAIKIGAGLLTPLASFGVALAALNPLAWAAAITAAVAALIVYRKEAVEFGKDMQRFFGLGEHESVAEKEMNLRAATTPGAGGGKVNIEKIYIVAQEPIEQLMEKFKGAYGELENASAEEVGYFLMNKRNRSILQKEGLYYGQ